MLPPSDSSARAPDPRRRRRAAAIRTALALLPLCLGPRAEAGYEQDDGTALYPQ